MSENTSMCGKSAVPPMIFPWESIRGGKDFQEFLMEMFEYEELVAMEERCERGF